MDDSFFYRRLAAKHFICISPLSKELLNDLQVDGLGDEFGYFVYESADGTPRGCMNVLAKCDGYEAAYRLIELYRSRDARSLAA